MTTLEILGVIFCVFLLFAFIVGVIRSFYVKDDRPLVEQGGGVFGEFLGSLLRKILDFFMGNPKQ